MGTDDSEPLALHSHERKQFILDRLRHNGRVDAVEVAKSLRVTGETIRKDLIALERQGLLRRVHGGAVGVQGLGFEPAVETRTEFASEKIRIARAALAHLPEQGSVLIDAGSTTAKLVELFPGDRELTVYTDTVPHAVALLTRPRLTVFTLGGRLRPNTFAEVGDWTARALAEINVDVAFLGDERDHGDARTDHTRPDRGRCETTDAGLRPMRVLLADHSKVGMISGVQHADLADIDLLITDTGLSDERYGELQTSGLTVERT